MTWRVALRLGRVSNLPTIWTNVMAGVILQGGEPRLSLILPLAGALSLIYVAGMFLNDAFDRKVDAGQRADRPIPSGLATPGEVFIAGYAMLGGALFLLAVPFVAAPALAAPGLAARQGTAWMPAVSGVILAMLVVYYDAHHKRNPAAPLVMGLCRVMVYVTAAVAVGWPLEPPVLAGGAVLLCYMIGLTGIARQETLAELRRVWPLVLLAAPIVYVLPGAVSGLSMPGSGNWPGAVAEAGLAPAVLLAGFAAWTIHAVSFLVWKPRRDIQRGVTGLLAGICLVDGLLIAARGAAGAAGLCVLGFALTHALQRFVKGT